MLCPVSTSIPSANLPSTAEAACTFWQDASRDDELAVEESGLELLVPSARFLSTREALFMDSNGRDVEFGEEATADDWYRHLHLYLQFVLWCLRCAAVQELKGAADLLEQHLAQAQIYRAMLTIDTELIAVEVRYLLLEQAVPQKQLQDQDEHH